jgi:hypothetical protein
LPSFFDFLGNFFLHFGELVAHFLAILEKFCKYLRRFFSLGKRNYRDCSTLKEFFFNILATIF